jgi:glycosyltransferase involved in cell wall biosynthesis
MKRHLNYILIGDTHPEMIAVACEYSKKNEAFKILLPFYVTKRESQFLGKFLHKNSKIQVWLKKRTLPEPIRASNVIRPFASLDLSLWLLKKFNLNYEAYRVLRTYKFLVQLFLKIYIPIHSHATTICYDTIKLPKKLKNEIVVICPMTHPNRVSTDLTAAKLDFPSWPDEIGKDVTGIRSTCERADRLVVLSSYAKDSFESEGYATEKIYTIPIGPINGNFDFIDWENKSIQTPLKVLFVGQMSLRKGVPALMQLSYEIQNLATLRLVGPASNNLVNFIRDNSNSETLTLIPNPSPIALREEFKRADVFVMPSYNEGFGIACVESMSFGHIPILSSSTGVSEALIGTPLEPFIIRPGSSVDLLSRLHYIKELSEDESQALRSCSVEISKSLSLDNFAKDITAKLAKST